MPREVSDMILEQDQPWPFASVTLVVGANFDKISFVAAEKRAYQPHLMRNRADSFTVMNVPSLHACARPLMWSNGPEQFQSE